MKFLCSLLALICAIDAASVPYRPSTNLGLINGIIVGGGSNSNNFNQAACYGLGCGPLNINPIRYM